MTHVKAEPLQLLESRLKSFPEQLLMNTTFRDNGMEQPSRSGTLDHVEEDPLLQDTINALMQGGSGIEAVAASSDNGPRITNQDDVDNERNYECNFCGKLFTRSNTLSYHLKVHMDERPFKCGTCEKAFREQYRLTKHLKTHSRETIGGTIGSHQDQDTELSQDSSFQSTSCKTGEDEDYATGDSERFFRSLELQDNAATMKLEPDISLTVDSTNPPTQSSDNDVRYQIVEERIKSLQREVHLINQNLNRVETKIDGLTKILAIFMNKFDEAHQQPSSSSTSSTNAIIPLPLLSIPVENLPTIQQSMQPAIQQIQMIQQPPVVQPTIRLPQPPQTPIISTLDRHVTQMATNSLGPSLSTPQESNNNSHHTNINNNGINDTFPEIPELPIRTVNDFLDLNDHCTDNEQFLLQMMIRLHQEIDGSQPHQRNVKKMMEALVTYDVLCQFSWSGKSAINGQYTKYVFGNSVGIIDLLTKTLNLGRTDEEAETNRKPIFTAIQSFIKHSRQNMLRDSRKRRDASSYPGGSVYPPALADVVPKVCKIE